jgi:SAM-dependent methyltransferase
MTYADRQNTALDRLRGLRIDNILAKAEMDTHRERFDRLRNRNENGTAPVAVSAFQLFQTPAPLARELVNLLDLRGGERVLEPSAGLGRILDELAHFRPAEVVAVEVASQLCAHLFKQDRGGVKLLQRDFLTVSPAELGTFDRVAMNPPFHLRADIAHVLHACKFLKSGGVLAGICMDTPHRENALRYLCNHWQPLPPGEFKGEGTNVPTVLFRIVKP